MLNLVSAVAAAFGRRFSVLIVASLAGPCVGGISVARADDAFAWRVTAPDAFPTTPGGSIPIAITVNAPTDNVQLVSQQFYEKVTGEPLWKLRLSNQNSDCLGRAISGEASGTTLDKGKVYHYFLCPESTEAAKEKLHVYGDFPGKITINSSAKAAGEEIKIEVLSTSDCRKAFGALIVLVSILVSLALGRVVRGPVDKSRISEAKALHTSLPEASRVAWMTPRTEKKIMKNIGEAVNVEEGPYLPAQVLLIASLFCVGINTIVLSDSFGTVKDLLTCGLWGFGSPIGTRAITSLAELLAK